MDRGEQPGPSVAPLSLGASTQGWGPSAACAGPRDGKPAPSWAVCEARCQRPRASLKQTRCFIKPQQGKKSHRDSTGGLADWGSPYEGLKPGSALWTHLALVLFSLELNPETWGVFLWQWSVSQCPMADPNLDVFIQKSRSTCGRRQMVTSPVSRFCWSGQASTAGKQQINQQIQFACLEAQGSLWCHPPHSTCVQA